VCQHRRRKFSWPNCRGGDRLGSGILLFGCINIMLGAKAEKKLCGGHYCFLCFRPSCHNRLHQPTPTSLRGPIWIYTTSKPPSTIGVYTKPSSTVWFCTPSAICASVRTTVRTTPKPSGGLRPSSALCAPAAGRDGPPATGPSAKSRRPNVFLYSNLCMIQHSI